MAQITALLANFFCVVVDEADYRSSRGSSSRAKKADATFTSWVPRWRPTSLLGRRRSNVPHLPDRRVRLPRATRLQGNDPLKHLYQISSVISTSVST